MFEGFSDETFEFYMAIRFNNNRDFFRENHDWYERAVRRPMILLCEALGPAVTRIDPALEVRPNKCVARVNRDVRYARDKSPYRDYSFMKFRRPDEENTRALGLYFDLSDSGASYGMGIYESNPPLMRALSQAILTRPDEVRAALGPLSGFTPHFNVIKRMAVPDSVPDDLRGWYALRGFYVEKVIDDFNLIKSPDLADVIVRGYNQAAPLYKLLTNLSPAE